MGDPPRGPRTKSGYKKKSGPRVKAGYKPKRKHSKALEKRPVKLKTRKELLEQTKRMLDFLSIGMGSESLNQEDWQVTYNSYLENFEISGTKIEDFLNPDQQKLYYFFLGDTTGPNYLGLCLVVFSLYLKDKKSFDSLNLVTQSNLREWIELANKQVTALKALVEHQELLPPFRLPGISKLAKGTYKTAFDGEEVQVNLDSTYAGGTHKKSFRVERKVKTYMKRGKRYKKTYKIKTRNPPELRARTDFGFKGPKSKRGVAEVPAYSIGYGEVVGVRRAPKGSENGGGVLIRYIVDYKGERREILLSMAHLDDIPEDLKKGTMVTPETILGTAHYIPRTGRNYLCIGVGLLPKRGGRRWKDREVNLSIYDVMGLRNYPPL